MTQQERIWREYQALPSGCEMPRDEWLAYIADKPEWFRKNILGILLLPPVRVTKRCLLMGCPWPPFSLGMCKGHYSAARQKYDEAFREKERQRSLQRAHRRWASGPQDEPWRSGEMPDEAG